MVGNRAHTYPLYTHGFVSNNKILSIIQNCLIELTEHITDGMCASSPEIQSTLKIGRQAELYHSEDNLEASVETYRWTLCLLVPLLALEPRGLRRDLLHKQVH